MLLGELVRLDHDAGPAIVAVQPGAFAELDQHRKVGLLPGVVFGATKDHNCVMLASVMSSYVRMRCSFVLTLGTFGARGD